MVHLRSYIAGLGSSGALVAGAVIAFLAVGGLVAIKGLPETTSSPSGGNVLVETVPSPDAVIAAAGAVAGPATATDGPSRGDGDPARRLNEGRRPDEAAPVPQPVEPVPGPSDPPGLAPPPPPPETGSPGPPQSPAQSEAAPPRPEPPTGPLGGLVGEVEVVIGGTAGVQPGVTETIRPIVSPVDTVIGGLGVLPGSSPQLPGSGR